MEKKLTLHFIVRKDEKGREIHLPRRPYQEAIKKLKERFLVLVWHRRSGKTQTASHKLVEEAIKKIDGRFAYLAPTYRQAKRIVWKILKSTIPDWLDVKINESDLTIHINGIKGVNYPINSQIELLGADDPDSLRGIGLDGCIMDEYDKMPDSLWGEIIRPTLAQTNGWAWFLGTPKGKKKLYSLIEQCKHLEEWYGEILTVEETDAISEAEMESIKNDPSISEDEVAQEYYCSFLYRSGLIYKEFNQAIHVIKPFEIPSAWRKFRAMDYGETNPTAWGWYAVDYDGNVFKYREYRQAGEMVSTHAVKVKELTGSEKIEYSIIDPTVNNRRGASGHKIQKEYQIAGITTRLGKNNVQAGINRVREFLKTDPNRIHPITKRKGSPRFFIFDSCEWTKWEFDRYRYKENKEGIEKNKLEEPLKLDDHCFTGDTRILMANGKQKKIKNVKAGELVKTKNGVHPVFYSRATRVCDIVEARFSNGSILKATPDHKIFTNRGKVRIDELRYDDNIMTILEDFAIRIVRLKPLGKDTVYNLTVEKEHNYYANGILVKNCMDETRYALMSLPATTCNIYPIDGTIDTTVQMLGDKSGQLLSHEPAYLQNLKSQYPDEFLNIP